MAESNAELEKQATRLQRKIEKFERDLTIEQKESELIKDYKMQEGNYQVIITVYEANDLEPRGTNFLFFKTHKTACDAFVEVEVRGEVQRTKVKPETNNPIFDEPLFFKFDNMTLEELDRATISFRVYDKKVLILKDSLLGSFELDWTNVYFKRNHEIYRGWLTLMDPLDVEEGVMGYLLVNIAVLGAHDKITVHDSAYIKDPLTTMEDTVTMPKLLLIDYAINVEVFRAENLIPLDQFSGNVDAYVIAKFSGNKADTSVKSSCNPQWNELLTLGAAVPTKSKYILLEVRNRNLLGHDDIIGIIKIPFVDLKEESEPRWGHLYGPPTCGKDEEPYDAATKMCVYGQEMGSHYRGRVLYRITGHKDILTTNKRSKIKFEFPFKPTPVVPMKSYTLRFEMLDGFSLPSIAGKASFIHACIGQYMIVSKDYQPPNNGSLYFLDRLPDKKVQFPEDYSQIPDLIVYFAKGPREKDRICYVRIAAHQLFLPHAPMLIHELKPDMSLLNISKDEPAGYLTFRAQLYENLPPQPKPLNQEFGTRDKFLMRIFLYRAKGLPPMNESGDCDPKISFNFSGSIVDKKCKYSTYNPVWNQVLSLNVESEDIFTSELEKALVCTVYDSESSQKDNLIGEFMIKFSRKLLRKFKVGYERRINFLYSKPKWHPIINKKVDVGDPCFGHVLLGCALFRKMDETEVNRVGDKLSMIKEVTEKKTIQMYVLGVRNIEALTGKRYLMRSKVYLQVNVGQNSLIETHKYEIKEGSSYFNQMLVFNLDLPKNRNLIPYFDFKLKETTSLGKDVFLGFSSANLLDVLPELFNQATQEQDYEGQQEEQSSQTVVDLDEMEKQLKVVRERRRRREALRNEDTKLEKKYAKGVQELNVLSQLGPSLDTTEDSDKNAQLELLLDEFKNNYQNNQKYDYLRELELQKDRLQDEERSSQHLLMSEGKSESEEDMIVPTKKGNSQKLLQEPDETTKPLNFDQMKLQSATDRLSQGKSPLFRSSSERGEQLGRNKEHEEKMKEHILYNNDEQSVKDDYLGLVGRYLVNSEDIMELKSAAKNDDNKTLSNLDIDGNDSIDLVSHDDRAIHYKDIERIIKQEQQFTKEAMERQENYRFAAAVKLSLMNSKNRGPPVDPVETYQDYDTDPEENLDIIPEWYKGRKILMTDFEELVPNRKIWTLPVFQGGEKVANLDIRQKKKVGDIKFIPMSISHEVEEEKQKKYLKLLKPRSYICRIYVLKGKSLISNFYRKPTTYLRMKFKNDVFNLEDKTLNKEDYNPEYYICKQIPMEIPGPSTVRIEVVEKWLLGSIKQKVLGFTEIDVEERQFTKEWHYFLEKKPIELRNLYSDYGTGTQGRLEVWVDLIEKKNWLSNPPYKIHPPPFDQFELRVIVYSTKDCVYKNEAFKSNDVYVRGFLGTSEPQETDTHWACRAVGNFNYRFKFKVCYPPKPEDMYSDQFIVQIWDRDLIGYNNLIGEKRINLNRIHRIIEKAVKRKTNVRAKMKIREQGLALTEKFWFEVFNHKAKDEFGQLVSQGKVQLAFQLVPIKKAEEELKNGFGRSEPNMHPTLQEPEGRLSFSFFHPLDFFKQLCGPDLYNSICHKLICCLVLVIALLLVYFLLGQTIATAIVGKSVGGN